MGSRNPIQVGEWYHCFNTSLERRRIFVGPRDFDRFLTQVYLAAASHSQPFSNVRNASLAKILTSSRVCPTSPLVEIGAYCLTPRQVHFVLKEATEGGIAVFMQKVFTGYTMYYNKRNHRSGALFAGSYKSRHLATDRQFKQAINYVHMQPIERTNQDWMNGVATLTGQEDDVRSYRYSSLLDHSRSERVERKILGAEVFTLFSAPTSISSMLFDAQAYHRESMSE